MTMKDRMNSGGLVSLGLVDGMNDISVTTGLGIAACCNDCKIRIIVSPLTTIRLGVHGTTGIYHS